MHQKALATHLQSRLIDQRSLIHDANPDISVIMPIYNAMPYLKDAVESVLRQEGVRLELICVDDGSTDGGAELLFSYLEHPNLRIVLQDNSGSPSAPRNRGLDIATGEFVYFLDADDMLYENALSKMLSEARKTGNDHVLGKIKGIGGRNAMPQIFRKTDSNAGLLSNYAWHNLAPTGKLIRKGLIDRLSLRFPEDQWVGEDQIFFGELYLNGSGISVLADQDYVGFRNRDDGENTTSRKQTLLDKQKTLCRLSNVISKHCCEGRVRDQLAQRLFTSTMRGVFDGIYQVADEIEKAKFLKALHEQVAPLYGGAIESHVTKKIAIVMSLIKQGHFRETDDFIEWVDEVGMHYVMRGNRLVINAPGLTNLEPNSVDFEVPTEGILNPEQSDIEVRDGELTMAGTVSVPQVTSNPTGIDLILRERNTGEEVSLPAFTFSANKSENDLNIKVVFNVPPTTEIPVGAWGTFVRCTWGRSRVEARWGHRTAKVPNKKHYFEVAGSKPVVAYFNSGYENLTLDVGCTVHNETEVNQLKHLE